MKLTFEEIKNIVFGAVSINNEEDGIHFRKCTKKQIDAWYELGTYLGQRAEMTSGVTIDFHTDARYVEFVVIGNRFEVLTDGVLTQQVLSEHEEEGNERSIYVELPEGEHRVTLVFPSHDIGMLKSITVEDGAYICQHQFDKKILFIGDSITQGWNSKFDCMSFAHGVQKYGGDFKGELTQDGNFCCDGMVFSDRSLKSGSFEVKAAYQPITSEYKEGSLWITNRYDFTNLNECDIHYVVEVDGKVLKSEKVALDLGPHATAELKLNLPVYECELGAFINVSLKKEGKEVAKTQHEVQHIVNKKIELSGCAGMTQDEQRIYISGDGFAYIFSKQYGNFESIRINGEEQICAIPRLSTHRATIDNEGSMKVLWNNVNIWQGENIDVQFSKVYDCYGM